MSIVYCGVERCTIFGGSFRHKGATDCKIQGDADVLLFPDIHAGNLVYKASQAETTLLEKLVSLNCMIVSYYQTECDVFAKVLGTKAV